MKTVLISGANRGIGLALTRHYQERGDNVLALCREPSSELEQSGAEIHSGVDVTDQAALDALAARLTGRTIDVLLSNAGLMIYENLDDLDWDNVRQQYEVNALGPLRLVRTFLPLMAEGGTVAIVSSRVGSLADNGSGGNYGYRMSKVAVNMAAVNLAHDLRPRGISVVILHPGFVKTGMVEFRGDVEPEKAARGLAERIDESSLANTGTFWHANGEQLPW